MREEFLNLPVFNSNSPFQVCLAGISYCDGTYRISRKGPIDFCVAEYVISGRGTVKTNGKTFHPSAGDTYLLVPGVEHEYFSNDKDPWVKIWVNVSGKMVDALIDTYSLRNTTVFNCNSLPYFEKIHTLTQDKELSVDDIAEKCALCFHEFLQFLHRHNQYGNVCPEAEILKNYIDKNIAEPLSIEKLSSLIFKSRSQTIRIFKKQYHVTPYDYYMGKRIEKACALLKGTDYPIKQIAYNLGFCDEHYFSGVFRSKTGKSPSEYRLMFNNFLGI